MSVLVRSRWMRSLLAALLFGVLAGALGGCAAEHSSTQQALSADEPVSLSGTVHYIKVEGGCWVIDTPRGRFQPVELPERYRIEGLQVQVMLKAAPKVMSACQVAPLAHVESVRER